MRNQTHPRLITLFACLLAAAAALGCGKAKYSGSAPIIRERGSAKVNFGETAMAVLPTPEGPYTFMKALSPSFVELNGPQGKSEIFRLIGLGEEGYPDPTVDAQGKPIKQDPAEVERRKAALRAFKIDALKKVFDQKQIFIIRMSNPAPKLPSKIYALAPDSTQAAGKPPAGEATLLNAQALRDGYANIDLGPGAEQQPLFDTMLNAQLAGMIELKGKAGTPDAADKLWTKFPMELPDPYKGKLAEFEKK